MTPEQKAMQLVHKGIDLLKGNFDITETAKKFAILTCDTCIENSLIYGEYNGQRELVGGKLYWEHVKEEIKLIG